jgi:pimeloyl-ACP methyl ester carboxylesterase
VLAATVHGQDGGRRPLVIAHGLHGAGRNWGAIAKRLAQDGRRVICPDMRNHGASPWSDAHGYPEMAADLAELIAAEAGGVADVLGHSMGGKAAMAMALLHPGSVARLIVADIAPVAYGHAAAQRAIIAALRALDLAGVTSRAEADRRLQPAIPDAALRAFLLMSLEIGAEGPRWRMNLRVLDAEMDRIIGWPDLPGRFERPVLFLSGAQSAYVRPEHHGAIRAQFPAATFATLEGAGHWLHADRPAEFIAAVSAWLDRPEDHEASSHRPAMA